MNYMKIHRLFSSGYPTILQPWTAAQEKDTKLSRALFRQNFR